MKKSIVVIVILLSALSLTLSSCSSDDNNNNTQVATGSFEIYLDGVLFKQGTNADVGLIKDDQGNYVNTITIGTGTETAIIVSGFPTSISGVSNMDSDGDPGVNIIAGQNLYDTRSGTLTRTSASRISFDGTCTDWPNLESYNITGFVESTAWEVID